MIGYIPPSRRWWVLGIASLLLIGAVATPTAVRTGGSYNGDLPRELLYWSIGCISVAIFLVGLAYASYRDDQDPDEDNGDGGFW